MKDKLLLLLSIALLLLLMMGNNQELQDINYATSQSSGHFSSDYVKKDTATFQETYAFESDQFFQGKIVSVTDNGELELTVKDLDTGEILIHEKSKHLTFLTRQRIKKGNYEILLLASGDQSSLNYDFYFEPFEALPIKDQIKFD